MALLCALAGQAAERPNILFILPDDWGWGDLGCHGHPYVKTPNIDRLAREGTDFHRFTVASGVCSPSRTAVMTGNNPARFSVHQHFAAAAQNHARNMPDWLDPKAPTLPRFLKQAGCRTAHFGKWHLTNARIQVAPKPEAYGYDKAAVFNGGAGWAADLRADVHDTAANTVAFITDAQVTGYGTYYSIGQTGGLRGRKRSLFEGGVRTPFIVRWPGHTPAGVNNNTTVFTAVVCCSPSPSPMYMGMPVRTNSGYAVDDSPPLLTVPAGVP